MAGSETIWFFVVLSISMLLSWTNPRGETLKSFSPSPLYYSNSSTQSASSSNDDISGLKYDFYHETCPQAESIIKTPTIAMSLHLSYAFSSTTASLRYYIPVCPFFLLNGSSFGSILVVNIMGLSFSHLGIDLLLFVFSLLDVDFLCGCTYGIDL